MAKKSPDYSLWVPEFNDVIKAVEDGAKKYGRNSWLKKGILDRDENYASMRRHLEAFWGGEKADPGTGIDHRLFLACRALMSYTVDCREVKQISACHIVPISPDNKKPQ